MCVTLYRGIVKKVLTSGLIKAQVWDKVWNYMVSYKIGMVNGIVFHWDVLFVLCQVSSGKLLKKLELFCDNFKPVWLHKPEREKMIEI